MAKVVVEIPDNYVKFIKAWQKWCGDPVNVAGYIEGSIPCLLEGDHGWLCVKDPKKADQLYPLIKAEA